MGGVRVLVLCKDGYIAIWMMNFLLAFQTFRKLQLVALMSSMGEMMDPISKRSAFHKYGSYGSFNHGVKVHQVHHEMHMPRYATLCPAFQGFAEPEQDNSPTSLVPCSSRFEIFVGADTDTVHIFEAWGQNWAGHRRSVKL